MKKSLKELERIVKDGLKETKKNVCLIKQLRSMGVSNYEISKAVGVSEEEVKMLS